jgi:hypothetical protein
LVWFDTDYIVTTSLIIICEAIPREEGVQFESHDSP